MNSESPSFVAGRCHDASLLRTAHRHGFTPQLGIIALFNGCIEGIHIDVNNSSQLILIHPTGYFIIHLQYI